MLQEEDSDDEDNADVDEFDEQAANTIEELREHKVMKAMKSVKKFEENGSPTAFMALWKRKYPDLSEKTELNDHLRNCESCRQKHTHETFSSSVKMYFPSQIIDSTDHGLKSVCLLPTTMSKIYLQTDDSANIELDGTLFDDVQKMSLRSRHGNIRLKNVTADQIKIGTSQGDVVTDGITDANIKCEIEGAGNFSAIGDHGIYGRKLDVRSEYGDISIWTDCYSDSLILSTNQGNILVNDMCGVDAHFNINKDGRLSGRLNSGSIDANVGDNGRAFLSIMSIYTDSMINMGKMSELTIRMPDNPDYNIRIQAAVLEAKDPKLLNNGDIHVNDRGIQVYETSFISNEELPTLHVTSYGKVTLSSFQRDKNMEIAYRGTDSSNNAY